MKIHSERIRQTDKDLDNGLDYGGIEFPVREKDFSKIEAKKNIFINEFGHENKLVFPIYISDQKFEKSMDLLPVIDENKSFYFITSHKKSYQRFRQIYVSQNKE